MIVSLMLVARPVGAEERSFATFQYVVEDEAADGSASDCPVEEVVKSAVSERLGYVPWREEAAIRIETTLTVKSGVIHAAIVVRDASGEPVGERRIRSKESCMEVAEAVELAVAIAIDPLSLNRIHERAPAPPERETPEPAPVVAEPVCPEPPPERGLLTAVSADIGGLGSWRSSPDVAGGIRVGVDLRFDVSSLGLAGRFDFPSSLELRPGSLNAHQILAELAPCLHFPYILACAVVTGGVLRTDVIGLVDARRAALPSLTAGFRFGLDLPLGEVVYLRAFGDIFASLIRNTLRETGSEHLFWKTPPFGVSWALALGVIFFDGTAQMTAINK